nr:U-box domain-containing protein 4-like isoform X1 [Ipomoea batatas]
MKCGGPRDNHISPDPMENSVASPDSARSTGSPRKSLLSSSGVQSEASSSSHSCSSSEECLPGIGSDVVSLKSYEDKLASSGARSMNSGGHFSMLLSSKALAEKDSRQGHNRTTSAPSTLSHSSFSVTSSDGNETSSGTNDSSDASVEVASGSQPASALAASRIESELLSTPVPRPHCIPKWSRQCERFFPRIVSSSATETRADLVEVEEKARKLVEDLKTPSIDVQRNATAELRFLAKLDMDNRVVIANSGAISVLVSLLHSEDTIVQENAVTAILNLSINDNNKYAIANADAIEPLVHVLETGTPEAKENAAATLFSISVIEDCKMKIGRSGAINALVNLLGNGTPRGKKDAATALFNLSILHENKARIVQAGAVKHLIELMDPAAALIDKAVAVLSNLSSIHPGRIAIGQEGGISVLVDAVELGSARVKEHAAAALMQLCTNSVRHCNMALRAGAVPPLVSLSRCGTPRAREKAQGILGCFRNQRNVNVAFSSDSKLKHNMSGGDGNGGRRGLFFAVKKLLHHRSFFRSRGENHLSTSSPRKNSSPSSSIQRGTFSPSQTSLLSEESLPRNAGNELRFDIERISLKSSEDGLPNSVSSADEDSQQGHNQTIFASPVSSFTPCVTRNSSISSGSFQGEGSSPSHPHLCDGELFPTIAGNEQGFSDDIMSVKSSEGALGNSDSHFSMFSLMSNVSSADEESQQGHNQTITASPASSCPSFVSKNGSISSGALQGEGSRPCYGEFLPIISGNAQGFNTERMLLKRFEDGLAILVSQFSTFPLMNHMSPANENSQQGLNQTTTASPASSCSPRVSRTSSISFGALVNNVSSAAEDSQQGHNQTTSASPDSSCALHVSRNSSISSSAYQGEGSSLSRPHSCSGEFLPIVACNELWFDDEIVSLESSQDRYKSMSSH